MPGLDRQEVTGQLCAPLVNPVCVHYVYPSSVYIYNGVILHPIWNMFRGAITKPIVEGIFLCRLFRALPRTLFLAGSMFPVYLVDFHMFWDYFSVLLQSSIHQDGFLCFHAHHYFAIYLFHPGYG